ncbi:DELTA-stichotoxin-Hcr4a-like [Centropristis striata]|uniref:DELTA-stichotoxin-Hcr4a-like n=1 Tax=Centropristis striata TaxID=184440 RepID=UPI0027DFED86|nr:DELTA-stichotoxin-Hcr4a-like [Centropristis striata]
MSESAEAVAANLKSSRNATIEILNLTNGYCLIDPKVYLESGHVYIPPQPTVRPQKVEVCNFSRVKTSGAVGVLTYDLFKKGSHSAAEKIAIMFSVPRDYNIYKNWLGLAIYKADKECNEKLYKEMYESKEQVGFVREEAHGCGLTFEGMNVDIMGTMSPMGRAIVKVEIWDKLFNPPKTQGPY